MLRLERLPLDAVSDGFLEFCRAMPELAPSLVMEAARAASGAAAQVRLDLLRALLTGGEGLHNNHHGAPRSPKFSLRPSEFDPAWPVIKLLTWLKLAAPRKTIEYPDSVSV